MKKKVFGAMTLLFMLVTLSCSEKTDVPTYLKDYSEQFYKDPRAANLQWFKDAGFGMFIHYGLYSQLGRGEWVQLVDRVPLNEYAKLKDTFTASGFDADFIVDLAKKAGMKYITITAKHHDGFCLFKTEETDFNSVNSPAKRDLIGELVGACDREGIGLFLYYSYASDWKHPWFYSRDIWPNARPAYDVQPEEYKYEKPEDFKKYIDYANAQIRELVTQYPTIAGIWFDPIRAFYGNHELYPIDETYAMIRKLLPHALISFKQGANGDEDFVAPERGFAKRVGEEFPIALTVYELNRGKHVEVCNTMQPHLPGITRGGTWGYNRELDGRHLSADEVKIMLGDAFLHKFNLLLNIGPLPDGSVHSEDIEVLSSLLQQ